MGRRALEPGENGKITFRGMHPRLGLWRSESSLKAEKVRPKRWRAEVRYHDPETHRVRVLTAEGDTKGGAEDAVESALRQAREAEGLHAQSGHITVARAARAYLKMLEGGEMALSPTTVGVYAGVLRAHIISDKSLIAHVPLRSLTALQIEQEMTRISQARAHSQLRNWGAIMNAILQRAVKARAIPENPMSRVVPPKPPRGAPRRVWSNGADRRVNRALTAEEDARLLKSLEGEREDVADLVLVMRYQGLRISEAVSLRVIDYDVAADTIQIAGKLVRVRGEGRVWDSTLKSDLSLRTLPVRSGARDALERRRTAQNRPGGSEYLFAPPGSSTPDRDYFTRLLRRAFDRAGLPDVTSHTLRRTVERELEMAGATVSERETFMGHTERVARMHYADHGTVRPSIISAMDSAKGGANLE